MDPREEGAGMNRHLLVARHVMESRGLGGADLGRSAVDSCLAGRVRSTNVEIPAHTHEASSVAARILCRIGAGIEALRASRHVVGDAAEADAAIAGVVLGLAVRASRHDALPGRCLVSAEPGNLRLPVRREVNRRTARFNHTTNIAKLLYGCGVFGG